MNINNFLKCIGGISILINVFILAGCSEKINNINYEHSVPLLPAGAPSEVIPKHQASILMDAIKSRKVETLLDAGLKNPKSVFVPGAYSQSNKGQLYLNKTLFVSSGGYSDVRGFVKGINHDLIAVYHPRKNQLIGQSYLLSFYWVSPKTGKVVRNLGSASVYGPKTITTKNAIYGIDRLGNGFSFSGFNVNGKRVSGPQNVKDATPLPNNGWIIVRGYNPSFPMIKSLGWSGIGNGAGKNIVARKSTLYYQGPTGESHLLGTSPVRFFLHTNAIDVDKSSLTDSANSNMVWTYSEYRSCRSCGNIFKTYPFGLLLTGKSAAIVRGKGMYVPVLPMLKIQNNNLLSNLNGKPINLWQGREWGNWVFMSNSESLKSPVVRVLAWKKDVDLNGSRGFIWGGTTRVSQYIQTPKSIIAYINRANSKSYDGYSRQGLGVDLKTKRYISKGVLLGWLSQYGILIGRSYSVGY